jgi:carboxylesterase type B
VSRSPVCPQPRGKSLEEEVFGFDVDEFPVQNLKQIESECLNLNITVPEDAPRASTGLLPVMVWIHGYAFYPQCISNYYLWATVAAVADRETIGFMMVARLYRTAFGSAVRSFS